MTGDLGGFAVDNNTGPDRQDQARRALTEALRLAEHGYALSPVTITRDPQNRNKVFRFHQSWRHESAWSRDPDQIKAWWTDHPGTSFALGGAANAIEGVDLDVKPAEGIDAVAWWAEQSHPISRHTQATPSGGRHLIWSIRTDRQGLPQEAGKTFGRGVDTRNRSGLFIAAGGYIVGEPGHYEVLGELPRLVDLPETPAEVVQLFAEHSRKERAARPAGQVEYHDETWQRDQLEYALAAVREHQRDAGAYRAKIQRVGLVAGKLAEQGFADAGEVERRWLDAHRAIWGPTVWPVNVRDFRDAVADGSKQPWRVPPAGWVRKQRSVLDSEWHWVPPENGTRNPQNYPAAPGSEGIEGAFLGEWGEIVPLPGRTEPIPTDALGPELGRLVEAIGAALQVPTDLAANLALPLITTAAAGGWVVEVEPGWTEPLCLATLSSLPSGERKSPTLKVLDSPLRRFELQAQAAGKAERAELLARKQLAADKVAATRKDAIKGLEDGAKERTYLDAAREHDEIEVPPTPRWLVDDATPEAVVSLLAEHGSVGVVSAEPGLFGILAGRYSSGAPNIEWFLKATSGEAIKVDRMGREPQDVQNPALSLACCIQPGRLVELGSVKAFRDSGLLARLLYVVPRSDVGGRGRTTPVAAAPLATWERHLTALAEAGHKHYGEPAVLYLDQAGRDVLELFRAELEPHLHPDHGRYAGIADWAGKLVGATARIAAAITVLHDPAATTIPAATVADAVRVARAYIGHAIAAFGLTRPNGEGFCRAKQVLGVIRKLATEADSATVTCRAVHQKLRDRAWVESAEALDAPLNLLTEYGHVRRGVHQNPAGGRPSPFVELHPDYLAKEDGA